MSVISSSPLPGRFQAADFLEYGGVIAIYSDDRIIGFGISRLFLDSYDMVPTNLRDAKSLGVGDFLQENLRACS